MSLRRRTVLISYYEYCIISLEVKSENTKCRPMSSVMREVLSVCGVELVSLIFRGAFANDTQAPPQASWCEGLSVTTRWSHLVFLQGKVNSTCYIAKVVNPVLLSFLWHEGDVLFHQDNVRPHMAAVTQRAIRGVLQLPWPQDPQIPRQLNMYGTTYFHIWLLRCNMLFVVYNNCPGRKISRSLANRTCLGHNEMETYSFYRSCHNHCWIAATDARCLGLSIAGWHSEPLWPFPCDNTRLFFRQRVGYTVCSCDCLGTPYCDMFVSFVLDLLSYTSTMINYLSLQCWIQWTCPCRCCIFFW